MTTLTLTSTNFPDAWNGASGYTHEFYALVFELILRLRANYLWPAVWGSMIYTDDPLSQPLADAYEIVLGSSHTEPMMRAQNEFSTYYDSPWAYNLNNETIDEYFRVGARRAKPYARNSLWTMAMRGTGDTEIEGGLGLDALLVMLEELVHNQQAILEEVLGVDADDVPQTWCLYKEVQQYQEKGLHVPESITLLWSDDNWGNVRRLPLANETERAGGAGIYYHFDYVGDPRDYKWINTIQVHKTAEQMLLAKSRGADRIWVVNVGDLKPLEVPLSHFLDLAYDTDRWDVDSADEWLAAWASREFGAQNGEAVAEIMTRYGTYAARRKYELLEPHVYSVINYNEAEAVLAQWEELREDAEAVHERLDEAAQPAFFQTVLHPITAGEIVYKINIGAARNELYAGQKRNSANDVLFAGVDLLNADAALTQEWDEMLDGKWAHILDRESSSPLLPALALSSVIRKRPRLTRSRNPHQLRGLLAAAHAQHPPRHAPCANLGRLHRGPRRLRRRGLQRHRPGRRPVARQLRIRPHPAPARALRRVLPLLRRLLPRDRVLRVARQPRGPLAYPRAGRRDRRA